MGGFLGLFDYSKPGPGVPKDGPQKPRIVVFFEIYTRKFWNLVKLNLMFVLFNLPAILVAAILAIASQLFFKNKVSEDLLLDFVFRFVFAAVALCIPVLTVGPAQAGFTYILRNYAREEHAFIWGDFKEHALKNFKEGIIISLIDLAVTLVIVFDIYIYRSLDKSSLLITAASVLLMISFVIYFMMHLYIYPMLVSFKLTIKQLYKNALIFSLIYFLPNLGILVLCLVLTFASFIMPILGFMLFPLITMSTIGLITNFYVYPRLKKHMFDKIEQQNTSVEEA
ncbi:MAG: DUF624 domain-containing protein [Clostridia bacterium]|nr:DUF624 domain-containing protein [Clostridia bacterium]